MAIVLAGFAAASEIPAQQPAASPQTHAGAAHRPIDIAQFKQAITDARRKMFANAMSGLSADQLQTFWAVYADYEKERDAIASARVDLAKKYVDSFASAAGSTDVDVTSIVTEMATLQKQNIDLRVKYLGIYSTRIDTKTAGRFALVDDYVTTAMRLDLLDQIPFPGDERK
jgi:hypothetical protein